MVNIDPIICAWVGRNNFGDELLAYALRKELARSCSIGAVHYCRAGDYPIYVHPKELKIEKLEGGFSRNFGRSCPPYNEHNPYLNALIYGGGSIFHSENSIRWKHKLLRTFLKRRNSEKLVKGCAGVSFGPFENAVAEDMAVAFIRELDFVVCRDGTSTDFAGAMAKNVDVYGVNDLAYSAFDIGDRLFVADKTPGLVGLSFILNPETSEYAKSVRIEKMLTIIDRLAEKGLAVRLVSLYTGPKYNDHLLHEALQSDSKHPERIEIHHYAGDIFSTAKSIGECEFYISMRLHGLITAHLTGAKLMPLNLHPKVTGFCKRVGLRTSIDIDCSVDLINLEMDYLLNGALKQQLIDAQLLAGQNRATYKKVFTSIGENTR